MERLFMLEVLVDNILFGSVPMPQKKQVIVYVRCGNFANLEIRTDVMGALETQEPSSKRKDIDINCGKSYVFPMVPKALKEILKTYPLQFDVSTKLATEPIGTTNVKWDEAFIELVESAEDSIGYLTPVEYRDYLSLTKKEDTIGGIGFYIRLTYLGGSIDTHIQIVEKAPAEGAPGMGGKQYLFKGNNNATTFQCEKVGLGSDTDVIPVAPVYGTADRAPQQAQADFKQSLMSIMGGTLFSGSMASLCPSVFGMDFQGPRINLEYFRTMSTASTTQSLRDINPGKLFLDLVQLQAAFGSLMGLDEDGGSYEELTIEKIEKKLCKNKDCPAAKLFKNYGIGPLANGNGLGGLYKDVEAPIAYTLSHVNGKIDNYGPLGTYSRPKRPENEFVPKKEESPSGSGNNCRCSRKKKSESPLRLSGGSPISGNSDNIPDPRHAFSDLMEDFNKLLVNYKNALGPCNEPTCPFAPNLVAEACRKVCHFHEPPDNKDMKSPVQVMADIAPEMAVTEIAACGAATCPFKRDVIYPADKDHKKTQAQPACRSPKCPYMRANLGLEDIDDMHMPPLPCPGKNCPFKVPDVLPPIHWDCPDPLPVGDCKNPDCPLVKKNKLLEKYFPKPKSACGSPTCPFTIQPCTFPGCPFNVAIDPCPPTCPYAKPVPSDLQCSPSICPFARTDETGVCKKGKCPSSDRPVGDSGAPSCDNPKCPYQNQKSGRDACVNPQCPYQDGKSATSSCDNPKCPYQNQKADKGACDNPQCPYENQKPDRDNCDNPKCPYQNQKSGRDVCDNPQCPYQDGKSAAPSCDNPKCPNKNQGGDEDACSNPNCPYQTNAPENECDNPECPFKPKIAEDLCTNPKCPFKETNRPGESKNDNCDHSKSPKGNTGNSNAKEKDRGDKTCGPDTCPIDDECIVDRRSTTKQKDKGDSRKDEKGGGEGKICKSAPGPCPPNCRRLKSLQKASTAQNESNDGKKKKGHKKKKKRSGKRSGYVYNKGTYYPGNKIGHVECIIPTFRVPGDMGWLWNIHTACLQLRPRRGWKPGAISKTIAARINEHRRRYGMQPLAVDPKKRRRKAGGGFYSSSEEGMNIEAKPTLQVKKKDGIVYVTMNPLKDPQTLEDNENPYMDCSPMQFKIVKNKQPDKNGGYTCLCDGEEPPDVGNSSSSELEVEFTPPAGIIRPQRFKKKKNVCHIDTQYMIDDIVMPKEEKEGPKKKGSKGKKGKK